MCGFAGAVLTRPLGWTTERLAGVVTEMATAIAHRGPDDAGAWADPRGGVALAHRRLSILDLSPAGHQPMVSAGHRWVLAFNGEIYNHSDIRRDMDERAAPSWRGHSDTETLLEAFDRWGVQATLTRTVGMFAFAAWDRVERVLYLARDRFGEKPLYYGWAGGAFVFGSELKALTAFPGFDNPVSREALAQLLRFTYVPAPLSIYRGVYKLEPGCLLTVRGPLRSEPPTTALRPPAECDGISLNRWWSAAEAFAAAASQPIPDEREALHTVESRLREAVRLQSLADVPLGAFLSGGVDSSLIVALMQQQATTPVNTFTVGFEEPGFDESVHARAVADHLGTDHSELFVTAAEAREVIPRLATMYDEPFADSSQIPTHLVCRAARQRVTVALSGDAGDELFGGYNRYFWAPRIWSNVSWLPYVGRRAVGRAIAAVAPDRWDALGAVLGGRLAGSRGVSLVGQKAHKLAARLGVVRTLDDLYLSLVSEWLRPADVVRGDGSRPVTEPPSALDDPLPAAGAPPGPARMMYRDAVTYLPDDILCKVDRAAMAVSLETRVPFLDHRVADAAWRLPLDMKIRNGQGKWPLRQLLYRWVPRDLIERPKAGFAVPVGQWLRGPLREWAGDLLDETTLRAQGYFDPEPIRRRWSEHLGGKSDWTAALWTVLMFQVWVGRKR